MRVSWRIGLFVALGLSGPLGATEQERYLHTDSIGAQLVETTQIFHCESIRARLVFVENTRSDDNNIALVDRWRITLASFSVSGRTVPPADLRVVEEQFRRFAWIERISARCTHFNREIRFLVTGMLAEAWAARVEGRLTERPEPTSLLIIVAENGSARIG